MSCAHNSSMFETWLVGGGRRPGSDRDSVRVRREGTRSLAGGGGVSWLNRSSIARVMRNRLVYSALPPQKLRHAEAVNYCACIRVDLVRVVRARENMSSGYSEDGKPQNPTPGQSRTVQGPRTGLLLLVLRGYARVRHGTLLSQTRTDLIFDCTTRVDHDQSGVHDHLLREGTGDWDPRRLKSTDGSLSHRTSECVEEWDGMGECGWGPGIRGGRTGTQRLAELRPEQLIVDGGWGNWSWGWQCET